MVLDGAAGKGKTFQTPLNYHWQIDFVGLEANVAATGFGWPMEHLSWSREEKIIGRRAFQRALRAELDGVVRECKERAAKIQEVAEVWELETYLSQRRDQIDRKFDFRYSVLPMVLGGLMREGALSEEDFKGLREDKLGFIRLYARD